MRAEDEINKLKLANSILNRGSKKLGVRPLNIGEFENPYLKTRIKRPVVQDLRTRRNINELAAKLKREQELNARLRKPSKLQTAFYSVLAIVVIFFLVFVFNPADIIASFQNSSKTNSTELSKLNLTKNRELAICSGLFKNLNEADKYKKELSDRLGLPLKILKDGSDFTIQIGPSYKNHEDALIVFDELSRYSVNKLSLRFV